MQFNFHMLGMWLDNFLVFQVFNLSVKEYLMLWVPLPAQQEMCPMFTNCFY
jgi:hypothetical protein